MGLAAVRGRLAAMGQDANEAIESLADWSEWVSFAAAKTKAPRLPGVYMAREGTTGPIIYIGMAGERAGSGKPQGIRGRLSVYTSGKALASGLGEAVFDRALADPAWLTSRLQEVQEGRPSRAKTWGRLAFERADLHLRWAITVDKPAAAALERRCFDACAGLDLWNRLR